MKTDIQKPRFAELAQRAAFDIASGWLARFADALQEASAEVKT